MNAPVSIDRRRFLVSAAALGGGMALSVTAAGAAAAATPAAAAPEMSAWIGISPKGLVTVRAPAPEIGNGVLTQCAMSVAEELGCRWSDIKVEVASANRNYLEKNVYSKAGGMLGFFGGRSTGEQMKAMLQAGASARERLKAAAAEQWKVPVSEIDAKDSVLTHRPTGRTLGYGKVAARASAITLAAEPALKPQAEWTLLGKATPGKLSNAAVVNGTATFGMDVRLPGMLYAALMQSPVPGGKLKSYDFEAIRKMPGVHSVVVVDPSEPRSKPTIRAPLPIGDLNAKSAVAVVADHYWQARTALEALPIVWDDGAGAELKTTEQLHQAIFAACDKAGQAVVKKGDAPAALNAPGGTLVEASYLTPLCDHATMEPLNGTALVTADRVDLWHPSQHSQQAFYLAVEETGVDPANVHVHQTMVGGGFGRRVLGDDVRMVVAVARKVPGRPVHVIWSREESMRQGRYRAVEGVKFTAKLGEDGMPVALQARVAGNGHSPEGLGNSVYAGAGAIPNIQVESATVPLHFLSGPYRGPSYNTNAFFIEAFIDEMAAAARIDPLEYRLTLLKNWGDPAWANCLKSAAKGAGWGGALPKGQGRGIAISNWGSGGKPKAGTTVAAAARVEVSPKGELKVHQIDVAFDCGRIVNKDAVLAQLEGGTTFGLNMSLMEGLTIKDGRIVEGNYDEYPMLRMADMPKLRFHFDALSGEDRFSELGEPPVGPIGPAVVNAIYAATGKRIRQTPLRKQDLSWTA